MRREVRLVSDIFCVGVSICSAAYAYLSGKRLKKVCEKLDKAVDDIAESDMVEVDISEALVNEALKVEVEKEAQYVVSRAAKETSNEIAKSFKSQIETEINKQYDDIKGEVTRQVKDRVGRIDLSDVKKRVIADATAEAAEKFHDELENVLEKFNNNLESVGKIYTSIEKKFSDH